MAHINQNYLKLPGSYLFSEVNRRITAYSASHPGAKIIRLSIGDVTRPLAPAVIEAMHQAVTEMGTFEGFHGYGPEQGYDFLREAIAQHDYAARGVDIKPEEIFVSDGAKSDCGNIGDIFGLDNVVAVCDPVYPVYVDTNAMAGRAGDYQEELGRWNKLVYMPCVEENGFTAPSSSTTPPMRLSSARRMSPPASLRSRVPEPVPSSSAPSPRLPASPATAAPTPWSPWSWSGTVPS